jgi:hypothetical protein
MISASYWRFPNARFFTREACCIDGFERASIMRQFSPFESGVQPLEVIGYRPGGADAYPSKTAAVLVLMDTDEPEVVLTRRGSP